jgi:hypothetical protein
MSCVKRIVALLMILAAAGSAALASLALAATAQASPLRCGVVQEVGRTWARVTVERGNVSCVKAETVEEAFWRGKGKTHCEEAHPYDGRCPGDRIEVSVDGWRCGDKGACIRDGRNWRSARDYILPVSVSSREVRECKAEGAEHGLAGEESCYDESAQERNETARASEPPRETLAEEQARNRRECEEDACAAAAR